MLSCTGDNHFVARCTVFLRQTGISFRNLVFGTAVFFFLWSSYYTFFFRHSLSLTVPTFVAPTPGPVEWSIRAQHVKNAFMHSYRGYEQHAWGVDELRPLTNRSRNNFNGWGVSIIDSLDTMHIMGLHDDFKRALEFVEHSHFSLPQDVYAPFFETVIRYLGGLLSAYALSREPILLTQADNLGRLLAPAFNTESGFPQFGVSTVTGAQQGPELAIVAEMASFQLEYIFLAKETGKKEFFDLADNVNQKLYQANLSRVGGMFPTRWNIKTARPFDTHLSVGAKADSAHEYLLKQYLLTAKTDKASLEMYIRATTHILTNLFYLSPTRNFLYVTDTKDMRPSHTLEHLSCFLPGLLALGAHTLPLDNLASVDVNLDYLAKDLQPEFKADYAKISAYNLKDLHMWAAEGLAQTCYLTYADQPVGLGPDEVMVYSTPDHTQPNRRVLGGERWIDVLDKWKASGSRGIPPGLSQKVPVVYTTEKERLKLLENEKVERDYHVVKSGYLLRPETLESLYILWRVTGNTRWREYGWSIFEAIEREAKTASGYSSLRNVQYKPAIREDDMPSYFLAETLKYLYLMFTEEDLIPLDKYVFNTEGHPFTIFEWTEQERTDWGIPR